MISCALGANSHCAGNLALLSVHFSDSVCGRSVVVLFCFALFFSPPCEWCWCCWVSVGRMRGASPEATHPACWGMLVAGNASVWAEIFLGRSERQGRGWLCCLHTLAEVPPNTSCPRTPAVWAVAEQSRGFPWAARGHLPCALRDLTRCGPTSTSAGFLGWSPAAALLMCGWE